MFVIWKILKKDISILLTDYRGPYKSNCRCRDRKKVIINFRAVKKVNGVKSVKKSLSLEM